MGQVYPSIDDSLRAFIERQRMFFVGTAPLDANGHVNVSPKGGGLRVIGSNTVAYLDHVGSGAETIAHLRENGRIVVMLCASEGPPKILRLHGTGEVLEPQDAGYFDLLGICGASDAPRSIVRITVQRVSDSCGFGVPYLAFQSERPHLTQWAARKGADGLRVYQQEKNAVSTDGLPALRWTAGSVRGPFEEA